MEVRRRAACLPCGGGMRVGSGSLIDRERSLLMVKLRPGGSLALVVLPNSGRPFLGATLGAVAAVVLSGITAAGQRRGRAPAACRQGELFHDQLATLGDGRLSRTRARQLIRGVVSSVIVLLGVAGGFVVLPRLGGALVRKWTSARSLVMMSSPRTGELGNGGAQC
jgi:hypothetical protein